MLNEPAELRGWIRFDDDFLALAHRHQEPPAAANNGGPWTTWLMLGGRGAGNLASCPKPMRAASRSPFNAKSRSSPLTRRAPPATLSLKGRG